MAGLTSYRLPCPDPPPAAVPGPRPDRHNTGANAPVQLGRRHRYSPGIYREPAAIGPTEPAFRIERIQYAAAAAPPQHSALDPPGEHPDLGRHSRTDRMKAGLAVRCEPKCAVSKRARSGVSHDQNLDANGNRFILMLRFPIPRRSSAASVCICNSVTDRETCAAEERGHDSRSRLTAELGVATRCGKCAPCTRRLLNDGLSEAAWIALAASAAA